MGKRHADSLGESEAEAFEASQPPPAKSARPQQPPLPDALQLQAHGHLVGDALWPQMPMPMRMQSGPSQPPCPPPALQPAFGFGGGQRPDVGANPGACAGPGVCDPSGGAEMPPLTPVVRSQLVYPHALYNGMSVSQTLCPQPQVSGPTFRAADAFGLSSSHSAASERGLQLANQPTQLQATELEMKQQRGRAAVYAGNEEDGTDHLPPLISIRKLQSASGSGPLSPPACSCAQCGSHVYQTHPQAPPTPPIDATGTGSGRVSGGEGLSHSFSAFGGSSCTRREKWFDMEHCSSGSMQPKPGPSISSSNPSDPLGSAHAHSPPHSHTSNDDIPSISRDSNQKSNQNQSLLENVLCETAAAAVPVASAARAKHEELAAAEQQAAPACALPPKLRWRATNRSLEMQQQQEQRRRQEEELRAREVQVDASAAPNVSPKAKASDARALCAPHLLARTCGAHVRVRHALRVEIDRRDMDSATSAGARNARPNGPSPSPSLLSVETALFYAHPDPDPDPDSHSDRVGI